MEYIKEKKEMKELMIQPIELISVGDVVTLRKEGYETRVTKGMFFAWKYK